MTSSVSRSLLVLVVSHRELPAVMAQRSGAVDGGPVGVAVEPEPVMARPLLQDFGVDDDRALAVGATAESDAQLTADRTRAAVGGDHIGGPDALELVDGQVGEHQLDASVRSATAQALVFEQDRHVGEPVHPGAQHLLQRGLVDELLRRVSVTPRDRQ